MAITLISLFFSLVNFKNILSSYSLLDKKILIGIGIVIFVFLMIGYLNGFYKSHDTPMTNVDKEQEKVVPPESFLPNEESYLYVPDENGNVLLSENDSSTICAILGFPCPLGMQYEGKLLDTNNVLVKIKGSDKYDVILNHTHICVTNESKTTCKIR